MRRRISILVLMAAALLSCSPHARREAQQVVTEADSLRAEGRMYSDSTALAQAYTILKHWQWCYADDYARACYHYGRLLREKDNPVAAMECFIRATHAPTRDYPILGRVYSNMGNLCHMACEPSLSCNMFQRASDIFINGGDTLLYYYALADLTYEIAEMGDSINALSILKDIDSIPNLLYLTTLTRAQLYLKCRHYHTAIRYAHEVLSINSGYSFSPLLILAQSYSHLGKKDSATYYAKNILNQTDDLFALNNALFILTNDDEGRDRTAIREVAAERADIQKLIEIRQGKLSQAVQLLEQDLARKPNFVWLYAMLLTLCITGAIIWTYIYRKRRKHELLSQHINDLENQAEETIAQMHEQIEERCAVLSNSSTLKEDLCWSNYDEMCRFIDHQFYFLARKLQQSHCLSEREIRLCVLSLLNMSYDQMAEMLIYAPNGIGKFKVRVAKKLGTSAKNLRQFLINMAVNG